jgi:hypothetical protein
MHKNLLKGFVNHVVMPFIYDFLHNRTANCHFFCLIQAFFKAAPRLPLPHRVLDLACMVGVIVELEFVAADGQLHLTQSFPQPHPSATRSVIF